MYSRTKTTYRVVELTTVEARKGFSLPDGFEIVGFINTFLRGRWAIMRFLAVKKETTLHTGRKPLERIKIEGKGAKQF